MVIDLDCGTIQGSILGPLLYAIYISPFFDIAQVTNFAADQSYQKQLYYYLQSKNLVSAP